MGPRPLANARFGTLGINPDQADGYTFQLVVTDANAVATTTTVTVSATRPTTGLRMVPVGVPVWLQGNGPLVPIGTPPAAQTTWSWTLDRSGASGATATLAGPTSQFATFTPDAAGTYVVKETVSGQTMNVYAGTWQGEMTDASQTKCLLCHVDTTLAPNMFDPWKGTKHYSALQRKIEGSAGQAFGEQCLWCHTVGYDKSAKNGGFDDVEATSGWTYPAKNQPGNWAALEAVPGLGQLAGIQCESCHGPQATTIAGPRTTAPPTPTRPPASPGPRRSARAATRRPPSTTSPRSGSRAATATAPWPSPRATPTPTPAPCTAAAATRRRASPATPAASPRVTTPTSPATASRSAPATPWPRRPSSRASA